MTGINRERMEIKADIAARAKTEGDGEGRENARENTGKKLMSRATD